MKKAIITILCLVLLFAFVSCGASIGSIPEITKTLKDQGYWVEEDEEENLDHANWLLKRLKKEGVVLTGGISACLLAEDDIEDIWAIEFEYTSDAKTVEQYIKQHPDDAEDVFGIDEIQVKRQDNRVLVGQEHSIQDAMNG